MIKHALLNLMILAAPLAAASATSSEVERLVERLASWDLDDALTTHVAQFSSKEDRDTLVQMLGDLEERLGKDVNVEECQASADGRHQCVLRGYESATIRFSVVGEGSELQFGSWDITFQ